MQVHSIFAVEVRSVTKRPLSPDAVQMLDDLDRAEMALGVSVVRINFEDMATEIIRRAFADLTRRFFGVPVDPLKTKPFHTGGYVSSSRPDRQLIIDPSRSEYVSERNSV